MHYYVYNITLTPLENTSYWLRKSIRRATDGDWGRKLYQKYVLGWINFDKRNAIHVFFEYQMWEINFKFYFTLHAWNWMHYKMFHQIYLLMCITSDLICDKVFYLLSYHIYGQMFYTSVFVIPRLQQWLRSTSN